MPCRTAGYDIYLSEPFDLLIGKSHFRKIDLLVFDIFTQRCFHHLRLLVDLFHHEMLKAALFRCFRIPLDLGDLFLDLVTVQVVECHLSGADPGHLQVADIVYFSGMVQDRRYIGSDKAFLFRGTYDHGAFLTGYKDLTRIILKHYLQRIGATHTNQCLSQRIQRTYFVFLIVVIHQLDQHLGIRLGIEMISVALQFRLQFLEVLNDAVVYTHHFGLHHTGSGSGTVAAHMRVCIGTAGRAMSRPTGMPDTAIAFRYASVIRHFHQILQFPRCLEYNRRLFAIPYCQACGVITTIFQFGKSLQQDRCSCLISNITNDTAHTLFLLSVAFFRKGQRHAK